MNKIEQQLTELLEPKPKQSFGKEAEFQVRRDYQKLTAVYLCGAKEEEEENCIGFLPGADGKCSFKVLMEGMQTCVRRNFNGQETNRS